MSKNVEAAIAKIEGIICRNLCKQRGGDSPDGRTLSPIGKIVRQLVMEECAGLLVALIKLEAAADVFSAEQAGATDKRCGLVQPVSVAECEALNEAVRLASLVIAKAKGTP